MLAYLLMAVLYNSLLEPLIILFGLPVALGGAFMSNALFRYTFNLFSLIGVILLVGLAIKNGVLLIDRTNHNRERGMSRIEAVLESGPARLRAILMTSLTIVVALLPSALQLGEGSEIRAPLAATVVGGVIASTLLTLVVVPTMYTILDGMRSRFARRLAPQPAVLASSYQRLSRCPTAIRQRRRTRRAPGARRRREWTWPADANPLVLVSSSQTPGG